MNSGFPAWGRSHVWSWMVDRKPFPGGPVGLFDTADPATGTPTIG